MIKQIQEDHKNAQILMEGISQIDGFSIDINNIKSNILYFDIMKKRSKKLLFQTDGKNLYPFDIILDNIYFLETSPNRFRLVTHYGINAEDVSEVLKILPTMIN